MGGRDGWSVPIEYKTKTGENWRKLRDNPPRAFTNSTSNSTSGKCDPVLAAMSRDDRPPPSASSLLDGHRRGNSLLGLLPYLGSQTTGTLAGHRTPRRQLLRTDHWPPFDGANHRRLIDAIRIRHRGEPLLSTHVVNHPLLPAAEHGVWKNREVSKHPEQIHALNK